MNEAVEEDLLAPVAGLMEMMFGVEGAILWLLDANLLLTGKGDTVLEELRNMSKDL